MTSNTRISYFSNPFQVTTDCRLGSAEVKNFSTTFAWISLHQFSESILRCNQRPGQGSSVDGVSLEWKFEKLFSDLAVSNNIYKFS